MSVTFSVGFSTHKSSGRKGFFSLISFRFTFFSFIRQEANIFCYLQSCFYSWIIGGSRCCFFLESWMSRTAHFRSNRIGLKNEFLLSDHLSFRYVKMNGDWVWHVHIKAALYFLIFCYLYNERKNKEKENSNMKQVYHSKLCEYAIYHWILDFVTFSISAWSYASMGFSLHSVLECESIRRPNSKYIPGFTLPGGSKDAMR